MEKRNYMFIRYDSIADNVQICVPSKDGSFIVDREYPVDCNGLVTVECLRRLRDLQDSYFYEIDVY